MKIAFLFLLALLISIAVAGADDTTKCQFTCYTQPFIYARDPNSTDLTHGDNVVLSVTRGNTAAATILAHVEYKTEEGLWKQIPASQYGLNRSFYTKTRMACVWGRLPSLPDGTELVLFVPFRALQLPDGKVTVRYRIQVLSSSSQLLSEELTLEHVLMVQETKPTKLIKDSAEIRYSAQKEVITDDNTKRIY